MTKRLEIILEGLHVTKEVLNEVDTSPIELRIRLVDYPGLQVKQEAIRLIYLRDGKIFIS